MNGGLDPEYVSPENKVKEKIRWIDLKLAGYYTQEYKEQLRQEKLILTLELIDIKGGLSIQDRQIIEGLVSRSLRRRSFTCGLCIGIVIGISIIFIYLLFPR